MWKYISMIMLAFVVSMDSLSVGVTYGIRKIQFPLRSKLVIACMSGAMLLLSMCVGSVFLLFLPGQAERWLASAILIALGIWAIYNVVKKETDKEEKMEPLAPPPRIKAWRFQLKRFGIVVQVLKCPAMGDLDRSGSISMKEAMLIGFALSMDAFGAGISASFLKYPPLLLALLVCTLNIIFIGLGLKAGNLLSKIKAVRKVTVIPGTILICLGIMKIFF